MARPIDLGTELNCLCNVSTALLHLIRDHCVAVSAGG